MGHKLYGVDEATTLAVTDELALAVAGASKKISGDDLADSTVGGSAWTTLVKQADESRSSTTTVTDDGELTLATVNGGLYEFEFIAIYASPAGAGVPDAKFCVYLDGTTRGNWRYCSINAADSAVNGATGIGSAYVLACGTAAENRVLLGWGDFLSNGSSLKLAWAQNTSDANATIVRAGSLLRLRRIA